MLLGLQFSIQAGVLGLFILAPLPLGGDLPWAGPGIGVTLAVLWAFWVLRAYLRGEVRYWRSGWHVIFLAIAGLTLWQVLPLGRLAQTFSPAAGARWEEIRQAGVDIGTPTLSLVPGASREGLSLALMALATFFLAANTITRRRDLLALALALVASATVNAIIGLADGVDGGRKIFWYLGPGGGVTGTFLNKNHLALLLEMGLCVAVGVGLAAAFARAGSFRSRQDPLGKTLKTQQPVFLLALALPVMTMVVALLLSFSRAGVSCAIIAAGMLAACAFRATGKTWSLSLVFAGVVLGLFLAGSQGLEQVWSRFESELTGESLSGLVRLDIWKGALALLRDYWRCGVGLGAFKYASPLYESGATPDRIAMHAHNDWLEFLCEFGVPLGLLLLALMAAVLAATAVRLYRRHDPILKWLGAGALFALLAVAMHESLDYGLRKPGNLLVCMGALALATVCSRMPGEGRRPESPSTLRTIRLGRLSGLAFLVGGLGIAMAAVIALLPQLLAGPALARLEARTSLDPAATRLRLEDETRARSELAARVLRHLPDHPQALMQQAENQAMLGVLELRQGLAQILSQDLAYEVLPDDLEAPDLLIPRLTARGKLPAAVAEGITDRFRRAGSDLRRACAEAPTNGHYLALYACALERLGVFTGTVDEEAVRKAFAQAHRLYPNVGRVTTLCADGAWRRFLRRRLNVNESQAEGLRENALLLFRRSLEQTPENAERVYRTVWPLLPSLRVLHTLTPDSPLCHEALYQFLLERRDFASCLEQLDAIDRLNQARVKPDAAWQARALYDFVRQGRRPPEQVVISVARRRILLLGLLERWDERRQRLADLHRSVAAELEAQVLFAEKLVAQAATDRAKIHLARVLADEPLHPRALVLLARIFEQSGQTDEATRVLLPLVYTDAPVDGRILDEALALVHESPPSPLFSAQSPPFPTWRFLRAGLILKRGTTVQSGRPPAEGAEADPAPGRVADALAPSRQDDCRAALQELNLLLRMMADKVIPAWIQTPMIHYLVGRAHEIRNEDTEALRAYARALLLCPTHLPAAQAAARLVEDMRRKIGTVPLLGQGSEDEGLRQVLANAGRWLGDLRPAVPLETDFGGKLRLLGYTVEPRQIRPTGLVRVTFHWYCLADIEWEYAIACRYSQNERNVLTDDYSIRDNGPSMVAWRVGEVVTVTREIVPLRLSARQRRSQISPGGYDVTLVPYAGGAKAHRLQPPVECRGRAFEVVANE